MERAGTVGRFGADERAIVSPWSLRCGGRTAGCASLRPLAAEIDDLRSSAVHVEIGDELDAVTVDRVDPKAGAAQLHLTSSRPTAQAAQASADEVPVEKVPARLGVGGRHESDVVRAEARVEHVAGERVRHREVGGGLGGHGVCSSSREG
jgi:hypothetical protein